MYIDPAPMVRTIASEVSFHNLLISLSDPVSKILLEK